MEMELETTTKVVRDRRAKESIRTTSMETYKKKNSRKVNVRVKKKRN